MQHTVLLFSVAVSHHVVPLKIPVQYVVGFVSDNKYILGFQYT